MKFKHTDVWGFENATRGMRNPMQSYNKSDSGYEIVHSAETNEGILIECKNFIIGDNDLDLMQRLIKGGSEHRKYLRQIMVSVDITAPMYWWSELDTYKIGTVANSTSKMHKLATTPITIDCFETDDYEQITFGVGEIQSPQIIIDYCEKLRQKYLETKNKKYWKELVRWLPESWLQTRTWTANYEVLRNIAHQRQGHKLTEWQSFIDWVKTLPYAEDFIFYKGE